MKDYEVSWLDNMIKNFLDLDNRTFKNWLDDNIIPAKEAYDESIIIEIIIIVMMIVPSLIFITFGIYLIKWDWTKFGLFFIIMDLIVIFLIWSAKYYIVGEYMMPD